MLFPELQLKIVAFWKDGTSKASPRVIEHPDIGAFLGYLLFALVFCSAHWQGRIMIKLEIPHPEKKDAVLVRV